MPLHLGDHGCALQPESGGCTLRASDDPVGFSQRLEDMFTLGIFQGHGPGSGTLTGCIRAIGRLLQFGQRRSQDFSRRKNNGSLDKILQLPHVARPRMSEKNFHRLVRNAFDILLHAFGAEIHKVADEQ